MKRNWESKAFWQSEGGILINHYAAVEGFVGRNSNTEKEEMNKTKFRCLSLALAIGVVALLTSGVAVAQVHSTGITVSKTCPPQSFNVGDPITCSYTITNSGDDQHGYTILSATETAPCTADMTGVCQGPSGVPFDILTPSATNSGCLQGGVPVTFLGPSGNAATRACTGTFVQVAPSTCNPEPTTIIDKVQVSGTDAGQVLPPFGNFATNIINLNGEVCTEGEFCRTPGFWGTHTDSTGEKACAQNITQAVLDAAGGLVICGETIDDTDVDSANSAVEAICVAVQGQQERQLARQLTAAGLNCVVTNGSATCDGVSINDLFDNCNLLCDANAGNDPVGYTVGGCIAQIDCFNNGGVFAGGECTTGTCSNDPNEGCTQDDLSNCAIGAECVPLEDNCHEATFEDFEFELPNDGLPESDPCFEHQGPADGADCKAAKKTDCTVIQPGEAECNSGSIE